MAVEAKPVIAAAAEGVRVIDTEGKRFLDFGSGQMAAALGHTHPRFVAAVERSPDSSRCIEISRRIAADRGRVKTVFKAARPFHLRATAVFLNRSRITNS